MRVVPIPRLGAAWSESVVCDKSERRGVKSKREKERERDERGESERGTRDWTRRKALETVTVAFSGNGSTETS